MTEREQSLVVVGVMLGAFGAALLRWLIWTVLGWLAPRHKQASSAGGDYERPSIPEDAPKKRGQPSPYS